MRCEIAKFTVAAVFAVSTLVGAATAQESNDSPLGRAATAERMTMAASALLGSMSASQRDAVMFPLAGEARTNWSNTPPYVHQRPGLRMGMLSAEQRLQVHDLLRASLSSQGYQKVAGVMRLDDLQRERAIESQPADASPYTRAVNQSFGAANYSIAFFGDPRSDDDWAWLIQGHHLGVSITVSDGRIGFTPMFLGAGPLEADRGANIGWSAMSYEISEAVELVRSLNSEQLEQALSHEAVPTDVVNGVGKKRHLTRPEGLRASEMTTAQKAALMRLVEEYVRNADTMAAQDQLAAIGNADWNELTLSWRGALGGVDENFYYRVQGPRILIELTHQPEHIHTIVRDPENDYGERWLGLSYLEETSAEDRFAASRQAAGE